MELTPEFFLAHCKRRFGAENPTRMHEPVWEWMIRSGSNPYRVRKKLSLPTNWDENFEFDPDWCFGDRLGMTRTRLADGRVLCIAGEYEDGYDPDFCIYNDVILLTPAPGQDAVTIDGGEIEMYGYPRAVFQPTDFHTATLVGDRVYIIGSLGYFEDRQIGATPVYVLDLATWRIERLPTTGGAPGWIWQHHASYVAARHAITIRGGKRMEQADGKPVSHRGAYRLHLADLRWELIAEREQYRFFGVYPVHWRELRAGMWTFERIRPQNVAYAWNELPTRTGDRVDAEFDVVGVRVTCCGDVSGFEMVVEGELPPAIVDQLIRDLCDNLAAATGREWHAREKPEPVGWD